MPMSAQISHNISPLRIRSSTYLKNKNGEEVQAEEAMDGVERQVFGGDISS